MFKFLLIIPVAILVAYSQVAIKVRSSSMSDIDTDVIATKILKVLCDPIILSAYMAALLASVAWLYVVTKLPLSTAFPIYVGVTFVLVITCGWFFLDETITPTKLFAVFLIICGVIIGVNADA